MIYENRKCSEGVGKYIAKLCPKAKEYNPNIKKNK